MTDTSAIGHNSKVEISFVELKTILTDLEDTQQTITEATGRHRQKIKEILEDQKWNKSALATIRKINGQSETERADFLRTFDALYRVMMEAVWMGELDDLLSDMESDDEEGEE